MNWFRKKKEPEVVQYDVLPPFDWENATSETATEYLKGLTRIQIMEVYDRDIIPEHLHEEYFEVKNKIACWPVDSDVAEVCNKVYWNSDSMRHQFTKLQKTVEGMQTKLDRLAKLIENTEVTMSGKTAISL